MDEMQAKNVRDELQLQELKQQDMRDQQQMDEISKHTYANEPVLISTLGKYIKSYKKKK